MCCFLINSLKKDRDSLERKFKATDLDNNGYLTYNEFEVLIQQIFKNKMENDEIRRLFRIMDKDSSGLITMEGFYSILSYFHFFLSRFVFCLRICSWNESKPLINGLKFSKK